MDIKVLSTGCCHCHTLEDRIHRAVDGSRVEASIETITEMQDLMSYGVTSTPALVADGIVQVSGRGPSLSEVTDVLNRS